MKVLMICTEKLPIPPIRGGAIQTYIDGALPYLKKQHDITVLGINDPLLPDEETINGVHYVRIPGKIFEIYRDGVVQYLETHSFDLIHIFNRPKLVLPVRQAAPHSKLTLSMHNDMFTENKISKEEATKALEEVSQIVTVSDYIGNVIRTLYPQASDKLQTIYSGVDSERFLPRNHSKMKQIGEALRRDHGLDNKTVILFAGRLSRNKGVDRLVRALPQLAKRFNNLALVIVGSKWFSDNEVTDYVAYVRALAKKLPIPVVNTGFVSPSDIQNWFAAADIFVCTSIWQEPLARVHYEAMAAGLPIITTNRGGNPEVIQINENGLIVDQPEDPSQFRARLTDLLSNPSLMRRMGEKGRQLAVSLYNWQRVGADILNVWELAEQTKVVKLVEESDQQEALALESPSFVEPVSPQNLLPNNPPEQNDEVPHQAKPKKSSLLEDFWMQIPVSRYNEKGKLTPQKTSPKLRSKEHKKNTNLFEQRLIWDYNRETTSAISGQKRMPQNKKELFLSHQNNDPVLKTADGLDLIFESLIKKTKIRKKGNQQTDLFHDW